MKKKILCVLGTRPEAIKMAPIVLYSKKLPWVDLEVLFTGQHQDLVLNTLNVFNISPDLVLKDVMEEKQGLSQLTSKLLSKIDNILISNHYDLVLAQGDTTTAFTAALASFYRKILFGHVEAGLRSGSKFSPFPEEINRVQISRIADFHFCPTEESRKNLLKEGIHADKLYITGNTIVDAVTLIKENSKYRKLREFKGKSVIITLHRRENFGNNHLKVLESIKVLASKLTDMDFVFSVHPNPEISNTVYKFLNNIQNVHLLKAQDLDYASFISLLNDCYLIITDSGGIQEEALALKKPVLVMRAETERIEGVRAGAAKLIHPQNGNLIDEVMGLLQDKVYYNSMIISDCPYGNGDAAEKIFEIIKDAFFVDNYTTIKQTLKTKLC